MELCWDDLKTILHIVRAGRLNVAAGELGLNYTTLARRVDRAEAALGLKLFERMKDGYRPTDTAQLIAEKAQRMEAEENALFRELQGRDQTLRGPFTITAPQLLIQWHLVHVIDKFCAAHPDVELRVNAANDLLDLTARQADLAIRISNDPGDTLMGRRLTAQHTASFACPNVAQRLQAHPGEPVDWILYSKAPGVPAASLINHPEARVRARFDDMVSMVGAAIAGLGVVRMPVFLGRATPGLVQVPVLPPQPYADIWVVGHPDVWPSAKAAAFRAYLVDYFRDNRAVFTDDTVTAGQDQVTSPRKM